MKIALLSLVSLLVIVGIVISYLSYAFPKVDAAPNLTISKDEALIARGAYLANHVAVCTDCHSTRDWTKFSGPIVPGTEGKGGEVFDQKMGLPGIFYSRNITPHGISDWTDGELYRLITTGVTKEEEPIFSIMPFRSYRNMDPEDVKAIIAYIRTLPAIENEVPESQPNFPLNLLLRTIPENAPSTIAGKSMSIIEKGKYLATIASCADCHTPFDKGQPIESMHMAGGFEFGLPSGGVVRSANITPDMDTGIGRWTSEAFVKKFKSYADSGYIVPTVEKNGFNTVMPWLMYSEMNVEDLEAIFAYLQTLKPIDNKIERFTSDAEAL